MPTSGSEKVPGAMPEPESLVSRLLEKAEHERDHARRYPAHWEAFVDGHNADAALLTQAANHIEELEARSSLLVEAVKKIAGQTEYEYADIIGEAGDLTVADQMRADARAALRNLAVRPAPEQTANSKSNPNQSKSWNSGEQDEVEVRLSPAEVESLAIRAELDLRWTTKGPEIGDGGPVQSRVADKLRTALEEEGR